MSSTRLLTQFKLVGFASLATLVIGCSAGVKKDDPTSASTTPATTPESPSDPAAPVTTPVVAPGAPVLINPSPLTQLTNTNLVTVAGACTDGANVDITGAIAFSFTCVGSSFTYDLIQNVDGVYTYNFAQSNSAGSSSAVSVVWTRDATAPAAPTISTPAATPYYSSSKNLTLSGSCETNTSVNISTSSGTSIANTTCTSSAYSFNLSQTVDGTYNYSLKQTDAAGNISASKSFQWVIISTPPTAPVITVPASSPYYTNSSSLTIAGSCATGNTVNLSGASTSSTTCTGSTFSFSVSSAIDGTFTYSVTQTGLSGLTSSSASITWIRDTSAPVAPLISSPGTNPYYSSAMSVTLSGSCETNATVNLATSTGTTLGNVTCLASAYSFNLSQSADGTYNYVLKQTDPAGNISASTSFQWVIQSTVPSAPVITTPASSPYYSNTNSMTIAGTCTTGNTVNLSGAAAASVVCSSSSFSFVVNKTSDGSYVYNLTQTNLASLTSTAATVTWVRDTSVPLAPVISSPASTPKYTNITNLAISGSCESNDTVLLTGAASQTTTCSGAGTFSFALTATSDGQRDYQVHQVDAAGNSSPNTNFSWILDTTAPETPVITTPASSPIVTGDSTFTITGSCETGAVVNISGSLNFNVTCAASSFSFTDNQTSDATYNYSVSQTDLAGNMSGTIAVQWIRDTSIPASPVITTPASITSYSNQSSMVIAGTCTGGYTVYLGGDVLASDVTSPLGSLTSTCDSATNSFSYTISKSIDSSYNLNVVQESLSAIQSAATSIVWVRDTITPDAPMITSPSSSSYTSPGNSLTVQGNCEVNASINMTGDSTQSMACSSGTFSFVINNSVDGTYNYNITQTDLAGNTSTTSTQQWIRNGNSTPPPTISSPILATNYSNLNTFTISGTCDDTYLLTLYGDVTASDVTSPAGSLTQTCTGGSFTYTIKKTADGTYSFLLKQTQNSIDSSAASKIWVRDTVVPVLSAVSGPIAKNAGPAVFNYSATDTNTVTFTCSLDGGSYSACPSPYTLASPAIGAHSLVVKATDAAGNSVSSSAYNWTQVYKTLGLYHFDEASTPATYSNSSLYGSNLGLVNASSLATSNATKKVGSRSVLFGGSTGQSLSTANSTTLDSTSTRMTIEGWFKIANLPSSGQCIPLASKAGNGSNFSWEFRLCLTGSTYNLKFRGSTNGTTWTEITSNNLPNQKTSSWYHYVAQYDRGTVTFYYNGSSYTPAANIIGTAGSTSLYLSTASMMVGSTGNTSDSSNILYNGRVDECRISQLIRYTTTFTPSTTAFVAD